MHAAPSSCFGQYLRTVRGETQMPSFQDQFIRDALFSLGHVLPHHASDQLADFLGQRWPPAA